MDYANCRSDSIAKQCPPPSDAPPTIRNELDECFAQLDAVSEEVISLAQRLDTVLTPCGPTTGGACATPGNQKTSSYLGDRVATVKERLVMIRAGLKEIRMRVEV